MFCSWPSLIQNTVVIGTLDERLLAIKGNRRQVSGNFTLMQISRGFSTRQQWKGFWLEFRACKAMKSQKTHFEPSQDKAESKVPAISLDFQNAFRSLATGLQIVLIDGTSRDPAFVAMLTRSLNPWVTCYKKMWGKNQIDLRGKTVRTHHHINSISCSWEGKRIRYVYICTGFAPAAKRIYSEM